MVIENTQELEKQLKVFHSTKTNRDLPIRINVRVPDISELTKDRFGLAPTPTVVPEFPMINRTFYTTGFSVGVDRGLAGNKYNEDMSVLAMFNAIELYDNKEPKKEVAEFKGAEESLDVDIALDLLNETKRHGSRTVIPNHKAYFLCTYLEGRTFHTFQTQVSSINGVVYDSNMETYVLSLTCTLVKLQDAMEHYNGVVNTVMLSFNHKLIDYTSHLEHSYQHVVAPILESKANFFRLRDSEEDSFRQLQEEHVALLNLFNEVVDQLEMRKGAVQAILRLERPFEAKKHKHAFLTMAKDDSLARMNFVLMGIPTSGLVYKPNEDYTPPTKKAYQTYEVEGANGKRLAMENLNPYEEKVDLIIQDRVWVEGVFQHLNERSLEEYYRIKIDLLLSSFDTLTDKEMEELKELTNKLNELKGS